MRMCLAIPSTEGTVKTGPVRKLWGGTHQKMLKQFVETLECRIPPSNPSTCEYTSKTQIFSGRV